jgi:ADP-heptose:LPS heptosyltransferase
MNGITENSGKRFLLGQLGANGDCLHATIIAKQIKNDHPECHLTWAVHENCAPMVEGNPDVDDIWIIPAEWGHHQREAWRRFEAEAAAAKDRGKFDEIILSQIYPNNTRNFDGTVRPSVLRAYKGPITVPVVPALRTTEEELTRVQDFALEKQILITQNRIIFECASRSGQSYVTPEYALEAAYKIIEREPSTTVILSSDQQIESKDARIIDGSSLSIRETALLTHFCNLLIGCSSGISCVSITDAAQHLPMIQLLSKESSVFGSFVHEFEYWDLPTENIMEMTDTSTDRITDCVEIVAQHGFDAAKDLYHEKIPVTFGKYKEIINDTLLMQNKYIDAAHSAVLTIERYGLNDELEEFVRKEIIPNLPLPKSAEEKEIIGKLRKLVLPKANEQPLTETDSSPENIRRMIRNGRIKEATKTIEAALKSNPESADHIYLSAVVRLNLGDIIGAKNDLARLTRDGKYWQKAFNLLAVVDYHLGNTDSAADSVLMSLGVMPEPKKKPANSLNENIRSA